MIPLQGTVEIRLDARDYQVCQVVAVADDGDLLIVPPIGGRLRWASAVGKVTKFFPAPTYVPAAPGWWARFVEHDEKSDLISVEVKPVVAWRFGTEDGPVVLDSSAYCDRWDSVVEVDEEMDSGFDAVYHQPDRHVSPPEVLEDEVRSLSKHRAAKRQAAAAAASNGGSE